jgi:protein TonB
MASSPDKAKEKSKVSPKELRPTGALSRFGISIQAPKEKLTEEDTGDDRPWAMGDILAQDYVKGFKQSDRTALNTKEYIFYSYFQRIRQRLDLAWSRSLREQLVRLYKGGRQLASDMDHTTRVLVTLNDAGSIVRVQILEQSGTRDLDDAAVQAFNKAGPFPNPPRGIVNRQGLIEIRWDFVLKS